MAWACDHAGLTDAQATACLLTARGCSLRQIARELGLDYKQARAALDNGRERLERAFQHRLSERLKWYRTLLACVRNHRSNLPAPVYTYAPIPGGYDATPVTVRARPHGSVAQDFLDSPYDFLRVLGDLLTP